MITDKNMPASPLTNESGNPISLDNHKEWYSNRALGLTKREMFAMHAHAACISNNARCVAAGLPATPISKIAEDAVKHADALLKELGK